MLLNDYIWSVANNLVKDYEFSLLNAKKDLSTNDNEETIINLIKNIRGEHIYIRLVPIDYIWPNHINNDLLQVKNIATEIFKQLKGKRLRFVNLYIFNSTPSNEVHEIISQSSRVTEKNIDILSGYIDLESGKIGIPDYTFDESNLRIDPFIKYIHDENPSEANKMLEEISVVQEDRYKSITNIFNFGKPIATYSLIIINAIVFLLMTFSGGSTETEVLLRFGAKESYLIMNGEYWRFITPIFLHIGFVHFAFNNLALYYLGKLTEKIYGSIRFITIYLVAGIFGNFISFLFAPSSIAAGASGAIYGLFGALLYFGYIYPSLFLKTIGKDIIAILAINILIGFTIPNIDFYAHIGGLIGGFIIAAIIHLPTDKKRKWLVTIISIIVLLTIVAITYIGVTSDDIKGSEAVYITGLQALEEDDLQTAHDIFNFLVTEYPEQFIFNFYYGNTLLTEGYYDQAIEQYEITLNKEPNFPEVYYNLALVSVFNEDYEKAKGFLNEALKIDPDFVEAEELLNDLIN